MTERGKYIVFEGVGGSGKSTQIEIASRLLVDNGFRVVTTREPGGTKGAEEIRNLVFTLKEQNLIGPEGQMSLLFAGRRLLRNEVIKPNINSGINVLSDRGYPSTGAYQGIGEGGENLKILRMADIAMGEYKPDAVLFIDIDPEVAVTRNDPEDDPFDKQGEEYFARIIHAYRSMAENQWGGLRWYRVDGNPEPTKVSEQVRDALESIFDKQLNK